MSNLLRNSVSFHRWLLPLLFLTLLVSSSWARSWKDVTPGISKKAEVIEKFGAPTKELTRGGELAKGILYQAKQEIEGSKQAQFFFGADEVVQLIYVFPKSELKKDQIIKTFGENYVEKLNDSFKTYFFYKEDGMVVYFKEDGQTVSSITYQKPSK